MQTVISLNDFDIVDYEVEFWNFTTHKHAFYEIAYIMDGDGTHILNENKFPYKKGSVFLLTPSDFHSFDIHTKTRFCIITFNANLFQESKYGDDANSFFRQLLKDFENINFSVNNYIFSEQDRYLVEQLIFKLRDEKQHKMVFNTVLVKTILQLLLNLISNSIQDSVKNTIGATKPKNELFDLILYIQTNVFDKEKLKFASIANHFCKSETYINDFFKKHTNQSLKKYITNYKLNLVKTRLLNSDLTITQIADEFGFTDESHLNKTFKQYYEQTASEFRKLH